MKGSVSADTSRVSTLRHFLYYSFDIISSQHQILKSLLVVVAHPRI